jgi:hypothetical protein
MSPSYYRVVRVQWDAPERWEDPPLHKQRRARKGEKQEQESRLRELEIAREEQRLTQDEESWELRKREWSIRLNRLAIRSAREMILLVMSVVLAICSFALLAVAIGSGGPYAVGGSGLTGLASICGMINLNLRHSTLPSAAIPPPE